MADPLLRIGALARKGLTLLALPLVLLACLSCSPPSDAGKARSQLIGQGVLRPVPSSNPLQSDFLFGPGLLFNTTGVVSSTPCEGAVGSLLPPLSLSQCAVGFLTRPLMGIQRALEAMSGNSTDSHSRHIFLSGIERFRINQSNPNDCWAAALQITRDYMALRHVDQREMISRSHAYCPALQRQVAGADAYQIAYSISSVLEQYDKPRTDPHFCPEQQCIINALYNRHPVIMLGNGHAVVLVGLDYSIAPTNNGTPPVIVFERLYVLDPAPDHPTVEPRSPNVLCQTDAFLAY